MPGEVAIGVSVELGEAPRLEGLETVFETGTWSAHRGQDGTILRLRQGPGSYLWMARLHDEEAPGQRRVTIHCGPLLVERQEAAADLASVRSPLHYPLDQLLAMYTLAPLGGLICHSAGLVRDGRGAVFAGRSGAGKTTFMGLCSARGGFDGLSDDRVVIRRLPGSIMAYGTPWAGEGRVASNLAVPLTTLVFLHQSLDNELRPISPGKALEQLFPVVSVPWFDVRRMEQVTDFCGELVESVACYELHFRPEVAVLDLIEELFC